MIIVTFHLGQILSHYIKNEVGLTAYQEFNMLLNNTLTLIRFFKANKEILLK